eukprot:CAMPEP_0167761272 /NCGR_PEP_ID=MMETSP0110_2-20121227/12076_1 /TAXON_ID=629695 /ORGANISM="Gymnochlora sp., Strain CCMP2014" /LENGTH=660 /DNA_ID=CAMNT_0007647929 /DNA_START=308 /DNA_END=2290 /DNA_ORIENTATION=-
MPHQRRLVLQLSDKGRKIDYTPGNVRIGRILGEGSYGMVYQGKLKHPSGQMEDVVLKRVKYDVEDADMMAHYEHIFNAYLSRAAKGAIADFIGYFDVSKQADPQVPAGKWLVWKYEGDKTLAYFLNRRDCTEALGQELNVTQKAVTATVVKQILQSIQKLHAAGIIHRDIKPANIIFIHDSNKVKLIDLGACADLRTGTNYVPDESILDPLYCPPEDFVLPTTTPNLSKQSSIVSRAISPILWSKYLPDRFDTYSVGIIMMQLALPSLRNDNALRSFNAALKRVNHDLKLWRKTQRFVPEAEFAILDENDGAGFDLASKLLRERGYRKGIIFSRKPNRISSSEALSHPFMKLAGMKPTVEEENEYFKRKSEEALAKDSPEKKRGLLWNLFDVEARLSLKASATQKQKATVTRLQKEVKEGKAEKIELKEAQETLNVMESGLSKIMGEFQSVANDVIQMLGGSSSSASTSSPAQESGSAAAPKSLPKARTAPRRGPNVSFENLSIENRQLKKKLRMLEQRLETQGRQTAMRASAAAVEEVEAVKEIPVVKSIPTKEVSYREDSLTKEGKEIESSTTGSEPVHETASKLLKFGIGLTGLAFKIASDVAGEVREAALASMNASLEQSPTAASLKSPSETGASKEILTGTRKIIRKETKTKDSF